MADGGEREPTSDEASGQRSGPGSELSDVTDLDLFGRAPVGRRDWSHRRGEPRGLALGWTLYLMVATLGSLTPVVMGARMDSAVYRPAARTLMVLIVVGVCVLWPMLRATQAAPERVGREVARDLLILLIPGLTLVWPQVVLADWSVEVVAGVSSLLVVWGVLMGAWMRLWYVYWPLGVCARLAAVGGPAVVSLILPGVLWLAGALSPAAAGHGVTSGWMFSPVTGMWEIVRERSWSGVPAWIGPDHWRWVIGLLVVGAAAHALLCLAPKRAGPYGL